MSCVGCSSTRLLTLFSRRELTVGVGAWSDLPGDFATFDLVASTTEPPSDTFGRAEALCVCGEALHASVIGGGVLLVSGGYADVRAFAEKHKDRWLVLALAKGLDEAPEEANPLLDVARAQEALSALNEGSVVLPCYPGVAYACRTFAYASPPRIEVVQFVSVR